MWRWLGWIVVGIGFGVVYALRLRSSRESLNLLWSKILRSQTSSTRPLSPKSSRELSHGSLASVHLQSSPFASAATQVELVDAGQAFAHLETCLRKIEKQFLPSHPEGVSRLLGETLIDHRVFWDCFRSEQEAIVLLYHLNSERVVFTSTSVKRLLGYSPSDFRIRFHELLFAEQSWREKIQQVRWGRRLYLPLAFKASSGGAGRGVCAWDGYLAYLQRGSQAEYAVVLLYPAYCYLPR